jgi:chromosome segregation ATPase
MTLDDIPDQLQEIFDCARAALDQQITQARKVVDNLNAEKTGAAKALAELNDQITKGKADLEVVLADQHRASSLVHLDREITKARPELERLKAEIAEQSKALEALVKQRTEAETKLATLQNDARLATAERCRAQEMVVQIRKRLEALAA